MKALRLYTHTHTHTNSLKKEKGITLIALVITIIVLLILAGVTIAALSGNNGILTQAQRARIETKQSQQDEEKKLQELEEYINLNLDEETATTIADAKGGLKYTNTTAITDDIGNIVYIPGGFKVSSDSAIKVEEGIVIEDSEGNQFVWIPTGTYQTSSGDKTNELTRRQWATIANTVQEPTPISGDEAASGYDGAYYYGEGDSRSVAHDSINDFLNSAKPVSEGGHGGFYIGRYEQGTGNVCKAGVDGYVSVTRDQAKAQAERMYSGKEEIKATSQLISSYAWDTALNFMCQNSEYGYELATTTSSDRGNIGTGEGEKTQTGGYVKDCYSNIYDFLGNCYEWTTEYSSNSLLPCVYRSGHYNRSGSYVAGRGCNGTSSSDTDVSFRSQLYM